jgi:hypothetical protein
LTRWAWTGTSSICCRRSARPSSWRTRVTKLTGIKVTVAKDILLQHAVDQMLDAHQTLQGMSEVLGIAPRACPWAASYRFACRAKGKFLGSYTPATGQITCPSAATASRTNGAMRSTTTCWGSRTAKAKG